MTVNTTYTQGPYRVRQGVIAGLQTNMPDVYQRMLKQWGMDVVDFPYIDTFDPNEPLAIVKQQKSYVAVSMQNGNDFQVVDIDASGAEEFRVRYRVRVYTFVKVGATQNGQMTGYENCIRARDFMATCVRSALLLNVSLHTTDMELKQETMSENYSDILSVNNGDRWYGAVYHEFDVLVDESLVRDIIGTADTVVTTLDSTTLGG